MPDHARPDHPVHGAAHGASRAPLRAAIVASALLALAACQTTGDEMEPSKDTIACKLQGQRIVVRFTEQEARMLMPPDERLINLYQVPTTNGMRFSNGTMELRGVADGMVVTNLVLTRENGSAPLTDCEPLKVPKKSNNPWLLK